MQDTGASQAAKPAITSNENITHPIAERRYRKVPCYAMYLVTHFYFLDEWLDEMDEWYLRISQVKFGGPSTRAENIKIRLLGCCRFRCHIGVNFHNTGCQLRYILATLAPAFLNQKRTQLKLL